MINAKANASKLSWKTQSHRKFIITKRRKQKLLWIVQDAVSTSKKTKNRRKYSFRKWRKDWIDYKFQKKRCEFYLPSSSDLFLPYFLISPWKAAPKGFPQPQWVIWNVSSTITRNKTYCKWFFSLWKIKGKGLTLFFVSPFFKKK